MSGRKCVYMVLMAVLLLGLLLFPLGNAEQEIRPEDYALRIKDGTTTITAEQYANCDFEFDSVYIPASVQTIAYRAFADNPSLKKIYIGNPNVTADDTFLEGCYIARENFLAPEGSRILEQYDRFLANMNTDLASEETAEPAPEPTATRKITFQTKEPGPEDTPEPIVTPEPEPQPTNTAYIDVGGEDINEIGEDDPEEPDPICPEPPDIDDDGPMPITPEPEDVCPEPPDIDDDGPGVLPTADNVGGKEPENPPASQTSNNAGDGGADNGTPVKTGPTEERYYNVGGDYGDLFED